MVLAVSGVTVAVSAAVSAVVSALFAATVKWGGRIVAAIRSKVVADHQPLYQAGWALSRAESTDSRLRVNVETKMTRKGLGQTDVVRQLTEDKDRYRVYPGVQTLVCFVYDPELRLTNAAALERDLTEDTPRLRTVMVVAPRGT